MGAERVTYLVLYIFLAILIILVDVLLNKLWLTHSCYRYKTEIANLIRVGFTIVMSLVFNLPLGFSGINSGWQTWLPFFLGIGLFAISYFSLQIAYKEGVTHEYIPLNNLLDGSLGEKVLLLGLFVPLGEELFYRGLIQNLFVKAIGALGAILLTILVFVGIHYGNVISGFETKEQFFSMLLGRLLLTSVLGWLYLESQSIWLPIFIHALQDLGTYLIVYGKEKRLGSSKPPNLLGEKDSRTDI